MKSPTLDGVVECGGLRRRLGEAAAFGQTLYAVVADRGAVPHCTEEVVSNLGGLIGQNANIQQTFTGLWSLNVPAERIAKWKCILS